MLSSITRDLLTKSNKDIFLIPWNLWEWSGAPDDLQLANHSSAEISFHASLRLILYMETHTLKKGGGFLFGDKGCKGVVQEMSMGYIAVYWGWSVGLLWSAQWNPVKLRRGGYYGQDKGVWGCIRSPRDSVGSEGKWTMQWWRHAAVDLYYTITFSRSLSQISANRPTGCIICILGRCCLVVHCCKKECKFISLKFAGIFLCRRIMI